MWVMIRPEGEGRPTLHRLCEGGGEGDATSLALGNWGFYEVWSLEFKVFPVLSESHLPHLHVQFLLKLLQIRRWRPIPCLLWNQPQPARLIQMPCRLVPIAESDLPAHNRTGPGDLVHAYGNTRCLLFCRGRLAAG